MHNILPIMLNLCQTTYNDELMQLQESYIICHRSANIFRILWLLKIVIVGCKSMHYLFNIIIQHLFRQNRCTNAKCMHNVRVQKLRAHIWFDFKLSNLIANVTATYGKTFRHLLAKGNTFHRKNLVKRKSSASEKNTHNTLYAVYTLYWFVGKFIYLQSETFI